MYLKIENLVERKEHYGKELEEAREDTQEVDGEPNFILGLMNLHNPATQGRMRSLTCVCETLTSISTDQKAKRRAEFSKQEDLM
jgi:hypothetical protein